MKHLLILLALLVSLSCQAQWDSPGTDLLWNLQFPNTPAYGQLKNGTLGAALPASRIEYYQAVNLSAGFTIPLVFDVGGQFARCYGDTIMLTPTQKILGVDHLWAKGLSGAGVKVADIDFGIDTAFNHRAVGAPDWVYHPDVQHQYYQNHNYLTFSICCGKPQPGGRMRGNAFGATTYACSIYNDRNEQLRFLVDTAKADIITFSFVWSMGDTEVAIMSRFRDRGGVLLAPTGNNTPSVPTAIDAINPLPTYPACVAVSDFYGGGPTRLFDSFRHGQILPSDVNHDTLDFVLPGINYGAGLKGSVGAYLTDTGSLNYYQSAAGTSFSAPNLAGAIALVLEYYRRTMPFFTARDAMYMIRKNSRRFTKIVNGVAVTATVPDLSFIH